MITNKRLVIFCTTDTDEMGIIRDLIYAAGGIEILSESNDMNALVVNDPQDTLLQQLSGQPVSIIHPDDAITIAALARNQLYRPITVILKIDDEIVDAASLLTREEAKRAMDAGRCGA